MKPAQLQAAIQEQASSEPHQFQFTREDARELAETHFKLATIFARISGVKLGTKTNAKTGGPRIQDPDRPKRAPTAYILFSLDKRPSIAARNQGMGSQQVAAEIGKAWRALSPSERHEYDVEAKARRDQFFADMAIYKQRQKAHGRVSVTTETGDDHHNSHDQDSDGSPESRQHGEPAPTNGHAGETPAKKLKKKKARRSKTGGDEDTPKKKKRTKHAAAAAE
ncbi:high mobility group box 3 [Coemansia sp. RSA 2711]|nr:high mobility group box 3 [Coemansia sp. RSA 2711]KAJ1848568.1 high mobility group box 3 [Coemansia sp. RSA 2708]KAJ2367088.1 high mobility group box 3 [Coemansia sp. RSA 2610]KAJ2390260.1 high mobility group box 3 [Coemansia sp. RSA 2611]